MTLQTMTHRKNADGATRKHPALFRNRSARRACGERRAHHTADWGDRR
jgi:hypothetical protein